MASPAASGEPAWYCLPILIFMVMSATLSIDLYTPSLPTIQACFHTTAENVRYTVAMLSLGSCLAIPVYGPLSDGWGRRPILLFGFIIYLMGLLMAAWAPAIEWVILSRFVQGVGSSGVTCAGFAMVADLYKGDRRIAAFSYLSATVTLCLVIGPLFGGVFEVYASWRTGFFFLAWLTVICLIIFAWLPESLPAPQPIRMGQTIIGYGKMMLQPTFLASSLIPPLMISGIVAYVINGVFYFVNELHLTTQAFSYHQAAVMLVNTMGGVLGGRLVRRYGQTRVLKLTLSSLFLGSGGLLALTHLPGTPAPWFISGVMAIYAFGLGAGFAVYINGAVSQFPEASGRVSSLLSMMRSLVICGAIGVANEVYNAHLSSISYMVAVSALLSIALTYLVYLRGSSRVAFSPSRQQG